MSRDTPRWKYRFDNFSRALALLREAIDRLNEVGLSQLEKEARSIGSSTPSNSPGT